MAKHVKISVVWSSDSKNDEGNYQAIAVAHYSIKGSDLSFKDKGFVYRANKAFKKGEVVTAPAEMAFEPETMNGNSTWELVKAPVKG